MTKTKDTLKREILNRTPLPWTKGVTQGTIVNAEGLGVATFLHTQDQEFAIVACNAYEDLLAACKAALEEGYDYVAIEKLKAAIAKAEGRKG